MSDRTGSRTMTLLSFLSYSVSDPPSTREICLPQRSIPPLIQQFRLSGAFTVLQSPHPTGPLLVERPSPLLPERDSPCQSLRVHSSLVHRPLLLGLTRGVHYESLSLSGLDSSLRVGLPRNLGHTDVTPEFKNCVNRIPGRWKEGL